MEKTDLRAAARKFPALKPMALYISKQDRETKTVIAYIGVGFMVTLLLAVLSFALLHPYHSTFLASEIVHGLGLAALIYKLNKDGSCSGLSLRTQQLTALYLGMRTLCSWMIETNIHTILDVASFAATCFVVYKMSIKYIDHRKLKKFESSSTSSSISVYAQDLNFSNYLVVIPCAILALFVHPSSSNSNLTHILWAFSVYLEAVSVFPQFLMLRKSKLNIEPTAANYVFALGVSRMLQFIHWMVQLFLDPSLLFITSISELWTLMSVFCELVNTVILAGFCRYYIRSILHGCALPQ